MRFQLFIIFMAMSFFVVAGSLEHNTSWHNGESNQSSPTWREEKESMVPFPSHTMDPDELPDLSDHGVSPWVWVGVAAGCLIVAVGVGWGVWRYFHRPTSSTSQRGSDGRSQQTTTVDMPRLRDMPPLTAMRPLLTMPRELLMPWRDQRQRLVEPGTTDESSAGSNSIV